MTRGKHERVHIWSSILEKRDHFRWYACIILSVESDLLFQTYRRVLFLFRFFQFILDLHTEVEKETAPEHDAVTSLALITYLTHMTSKEFRSAESQDADTSQRKRGKGSHFWTAHTHTQAQTHTPPLVCLAFQFAWSSFFFFFLALSPSRDFSVYGCGLFGYSQ